jgi:hypothetical protein
MNRILPIVLVAILTCVLIAAATVHTSSLAPATTPQGAVDSLLNQVKSHDFRGAFQFVAGSSNTSFDDFARDLGGSNGSLRTYAALAEVRYQSAQRKRSECEGTRKSHVRGGRRRTLRHARSERRERRQQLES